MATFQRYKEHENQATLRTLFEIHGMDLSVVNGLRRTILTDIPNIGFGFEGEPSLSIATNTGPLHNEILLHRFSMISIHLPQEEIETFEEGNMIFDLDKKNTTDQTINVTTHDFRVSSNNKELTKSEVRELFPVDIWSKEPTLITRLRPTEHLHVFGNAIKSTARENSGFAPVSLCSFYNIVDEQAVQDQNVQGILDKERTYLKNDYGDPIAVMFQVETECRMTVPYLVSKTYDILIGKLKRIYSSLSTETLDIDVVLKESDVPNTMELIINHEDDTIGNILQSHFHNEYYRTGKEVQEVYKLQFVGYYCPHPLDPNVVVKMTLTSSADNNSDNITPDIIFRSFLKKGITEIIESFEAYQSEWHSFTGYVPIVNEIMPVPENAEIENGKADEME